MSRLNISPTQALDLEPDEIATACSTDSNRVLIELAFASPAEAVRAHDFMMLLRRGAGLQLNIMPTGISHPRTEPRLRPMPYTPPNPA
ncbi:hypothetical protein BAMBUS_04530 [Brevundimonas phage vB_BpoS-Bambus]|nr:hypothetical protein BAMBUS_04530 [Brevundimonas phage vB_BpoS-Bambus]